MCAMSHFASVVAIRAIVNCHHRHGPNLGTTTIAEKFKRHFEKFQLVLLHVLRFFVQV
jgi:hypothetical protein